MGGRADPSGLPLGGVAGPWEQQDLEAHVPDPALRSDSRFAASQVVITDRRQALRTGTDRSVRVLRRRPGRRAKPAVDALRASLLAFGQELEAIPGGVAVAVPGADCAQMALKLANVSKQKTFIAG